MQALFATKQIANEAHDELDFIKPQITRLPTRKDLARVTLHSLLGGAALCDCRRGVAGPALSQTAKD
jgi:hypothetical protein